MALINQEPERSLFLCGQDIGSEAINPTGSGRARAGRRSRVDICFEVRSTIHDVREVKPTRLMYKTNLSWNVMSDVLDYLTDKGLLSTRRVGARRTISLTQMGVTCLQRLKEARSLLLTAADISDRLLSSNGVKEGVPDLTPKHFFSNDGGTT